MLNKRANVRPRNVAREMAIEKGVEELRITLRKTSSGTEIMGLE